MEYIAFDAHKHYTLASVARPDGRLVREQRLPHERGARQQFLARCEPGSPVAVETIGNWYWIVDEIEAAGCVPKLVQPCSRTRTCTTSPLSAWPTSAWSTAIVMHRCPRTGACSVRKRP
jgi:hypothetical protein